jgi:hypothetical protein
LIDKESLLKGNVAPVWDGPKMMNQK